MFACPSCKTVISINTELDDKSINQHPPCPCGKTRMVNMSSDDYAYGRFDI